MQQARLLDAKWKFSAQPTKPDFFHDETRFFVLKILI